MVRLKLGDLYEAGGEVYLVIEGINQSPNTFTLVKLLRRGLRGGAPVGTVSNDTYEDKERPGTVLCNIIDLLQEVKDDKG